MNPTHAPSCFPGDGRQTEPPPPPEPRHGLPVPAVAARAMDVPTARVHPRDLALIEALRRDVRRLDFAPLTDEQVARQVARWPSAAASTAIEGNPLTAADHALARMFFEERLPAGDRVPLIARFAQRHQQHHAGADR